MTPKQRKIALIEADVSMADIARKLDISGAHVSQVVSGDRRSPRVEAAIAEAVGSTVEEVFGSTEGAAA